MLKFNLCESARIKSLLKFKFTTLQYYILDKIVGLCVFKSLNIRMLCTVVLALCSVCFSQNESFRYKPEFNGRDRPDARQRVKIQIYFHNDINNISRLAKKKIKPSKKLFLLT